MSNPHFSQTIAALNMAAETLPGSQGVAFAAIQAQATLALAFEQQTANLLATFAQLGDGNVTTYLGEAIPDGNGKKLAAQIVERLGLEP